jgi:UDP-glucose 4-epimerase
VLTLTLLNLARQENIKKIIFPYSGALFMECLMQSPLLKTSTNPTGLWHSKLMIEKILELYA